MSDDPHFQPINKAHAIAEMLVFFQFAPDLSAVLPALTSLQTDLQREFPRAVPTQQMRLDIMNGSPKLQNTVSGLQLSRHKLDGSAEWTINIGLNMFSVHSTDYTRWHLIWPEMRGYCVKLFQAMGAAPVWIAAIGLKYVDRFIWDGPDEAYDASRLFDPQGPHLATQCFQSGHRWHCHSGWFEGYPEAGEILNQLNVDSGGHLLGTATKTIVNIDHTMTLRALDETKLAGYGATESTEPALLDKLVQHLHLRNKNVLLRLLQPEVANRINLRV